MFLAFKIDHFGLFIFEQVMNKWLHCRRMSGWSFSNQPTKLFIFRLFSQVFFHLSPPVNPTLLISGLPSIIPRGINQKNVTRLRAIKAEIEPRESVKPIFGYVLLNRDVGEDGCWFIDYENVWEFSMKMSDIVNHLDISMQGKQPLN